MAGRRHWLKSWNRVNHLQLLVKFHFKLVLCAFAHDKRLTATEEVKLLWDRDWLVTRLRVAVRIVDHVIKVLWMHTYTILQLDFCKLGLYLLHTVGPVLEKLGMKYYLGLNDLRQNLGLKMACDLFVKHPWLLTKVNTALNFGDCMLCKCECLFYHFGLHVVQHNVKTYQRAEAKFLKLVHDKLVGVFVALLQSAELSLSFQRLLVWSHNVLCAFRIAQLDGFGLLRCLKCVAINRDLLLEQLYIHEQGIVQISRGIAALRFLFLFLLD